MTWGISGGDRKPRTLVVECKRCRRTVPANAEAFPKENIRVDCPLCGEKRMYRPNEVYLGFPHSLLGKQTSEMSEHYRNAAAERRRK
jgi:DNA-directed RNA polymerase subunit RPC12/RpoP